MRLKATTPTFYLLFLALLFLGAYSISNKVFYPITSNMGLLTDYYMSFTPDITYTMPNLNLRFSVPLQYNLSQISNDMQCYLSTTGATNSYRKMATTDCFVQPNLNTGSSLAGDLIINVPSMSSSSPLHFVFQNIQNPTVDSSSFFGLCVRSGTHLLECDRQFKMLTFTGGFPTSTEGFELSTSPQRPVVGQGTTYYFKFRTDIRQITQAGNFDLDREFVEIRVNFPKEYTSTNAICSLMQFSNITGTYSAIQVSTSSSPSKSHSIECKRIQNLVSSYLFRKSSNLLDDLYLKIENIENPIYSGGYSNQFSVDIVRAGRNQVVERIQFADTILISPEQLQVSVDQSNMMRNATNQYFFYLTHDLTYRENSKIRLTIGNNSPWTIHDVKLMFGFTKNINFSSLVTNTPTHSVVEISDYGVASNQVQQVIAMNLTSSNLIGIHQVKVETLIDDKVSGTWEGSVNLNATWGAFNRLSFSAVQQPTKLPVGKTGPLEFTLFLNYELPESQNIQNGSIIIQFTPRIAKPIQNTFGKVKCYFKATMQAAQCHYDDSHAFKTKITIVSPPYEEFQYSEIPIIITTEGGIDQDHLGLTISPVVERYKFQVDFFLYNSSIIPSEVLHTNWLANAIELPGSLTGKSLSWQADQMTALHFNLHTPLMNTPENRFLFQFNPDANGQNAWHPTLGYAADKIYKQFPCVVVGMHGQRIKCDLYTYVNTVGPYNKLHISTKSLGPFIMVYGFTNQVPDDNIQVYLPGIKTSTNIGADAMVSFSILQETPGDTQPYIELYHQDYKLFTLVNSPAVTPSPSILVTPQMMVQTPKLYTMTWPVVDHTLVTFIKYDFTNQLPSIQTKFDTCSFVNTCYSSGFPNNWIVETPANPVASPSYTFTSTLNVMTMPHISALTVTHPIRITTYSATGRTLQIIDLNHQYIPQPITGTGFNLVETTPIVYSGLKQWYQIAFTAASASTSAYPYIHLKLSPELKFASPEQCESVSILPFNETGIKCKIIPSSEDRELIVSNIKSIDSGLAYQLKVRLQTTAPDHTSSISPTVDILVNHNNSIINSLVQQVRLVPLATPNTPTPVRSRPDEFTINNPQILNEEVRVNYIGRLFVDFDSSADATTNLQITLPNHRYNGGKWSTVNGAAAITNPNLNDPLVCMLNNYRFYCTQIYTPLLITITIKSAVITAGSNRLQLDTEYVAPFNGLYFPTVAGNYQIHFETFDLATNQWKFQHTAFIFIHPPSLEDIQIASVVKDVDTESVYILNFTLPDNTALPNYLSTGPTEPWTRIFVEFPTIVDGVRVFKDNLGDLYDGVLSQRVGCAFLKGTRYVAADPSITDPRLECRLIPPQTPGLPVKVQIINFDVFTPQVDSLGVFIFGVDNPGANSAAINSFEIKVKVNKYESTGQIYPQFESDYVVFLDPRTKLDPIPIRPSTTGRGSDLFIPSLDVGDPGTIKIQAERISSGGVRPFYMLVKLPSYLPVPYDSLASSAFVSCSAANFEYCVTAPDVNYVLVKVKANSAIFEVNIRDYPLGISQQDSFFYSMIFEQGRYSGNIEYVISHEKRWLDIRGLLIFNSIQAVGQTEKTSMSKEKFHVAISFTTRNYIPQTGSIAIVFPASVTKVYPYCRSDTSNEASELKTVSGTSGEIGCAVQNDNHWVITGFAQVLPNTVISISGYIDLPVTSGSLGQGQIITYADNHPDNIYFNGSQIDYVRSSFNINVPAVLAMNPNEDIFLSQRDVIRAGDVGQFRLLIKLSLVLTTAGTITLDFSKNDFNGGSGGFQLFSLPKKVCQLIDISNEQRIGCEVVLEDDLTLSGQSFIRYRMRVFEDLSTSTTYELRLTTNARYTAPDSPEGIKYPTRASTYKIEVTVKYSTNPNPTTSQHLYLDVHGPEFKDLKVTQHNYLQNKYNVYWFEVQPFTTISTTDQLVIEFPTRSNDGMTNLFSENLGLTDYRSGDEIAMDIFDSTNAIMAALGTPIPVDNDFMKCHIHHGHRPSSLPVKIVCGEFLYDIGNSDWLRFAIGIINPIINSAQVSIPLMIYSQNPFTFSRTNFNLVNGAGYIYDASNVLSKEGFASTTSLQMEMPNDQFVIGNANTFDLLPGDAFLLKFNFPLRKNGKVADGCKQKGTATIYGDAIYHERLRTVVCKIPVLTGVTIPTQIAPTTSTLLISEFYTPWYFLDPTSEKRITGISHYYSKSSSEVVEYTDGFPHLPARFQFPLYLSGPSSVLTMEPVLNHMVQCQRDDYKFTIQIDPTGSTHFNLQYTRLVSIVFPSSTDANYVDFSSFERDCIQHLDSDIEIKSCAIQQTTSRIIIYIEILPGVYSNDKKIVIQTKGLAIRNPCNNPNTDVTSLKVNFFSWDNSSLPDRTADNRVYLTLDSRNILSTPLSYFDQTSHGLTAGNFKPFEWVQIPKQKYYDEFYPFMDGQYAPFKFDIQLMNTIAAKTGLNQWNTLTLYYGDKFQVPNPEDDNINDLKMNTEYCFLRNTRVQRCENDFANRKITMHFKFQLPSTEWINIYFSIQDPTNRQINGFNYVGQDSNIAQEVYLELKQFGAPKSLIFKVNPFQAKQTNFDPSVTVLPERAIVKGEIDYANSMTSQLNVIDITLTLNSSVNDIKGLKFEIPLVDEFGNQIFNDPATSFMGLSDGEEYPCGNNDGGAANSILPNPDTGKAKCYLFMGSNANMGQPTSIIMTDFAYSGRIRARFLIKNPGVDGRWVTIVVKAYKGQHGGQNSLIGHQYVGYWRFYNIFQTEPGTPQQSGPMPTSTMYLFPSNPSLVGTDAAYNTRNPLWMDQTTWQVTGTSLLGTPAALDQYVIFEAFINRYNTTTPVYQEPQFCVADWSPGNTMSDDMFYFRSRAVADKFEKVYFIKKWTGSPWTLQYFKCKHYLNHFTVYYHGSKIDQQISIYSIPFASFDYLSYAPPTIKYFHVMNRRMEIQIDLTASILDAMNNRGLDWQENINYAMIVTTNANMPFTGISACYATGGFDNTRGKNVICSYAFDATTGTSFTIKNFNRLIKNHENQYTIRIDTAVNVGNVALAPSTAIVQIYAGKEALEAIPKQYMYRTVSVPYNGRSQPRYAGSPSSASTICGCGQTYISLTQGLPPLYRADTIGTYETMNFNNYHEAPRISVEVRNTLLTTNSLYIEVKILNNGADITMDQQTRPHFSFRFYLEGITVNCGSSYSVFGNSNYGLDADGNILLTSIQLTRGFRCLGTNSFYYGSFQHAVNNVPFTGTGSTSRQQFSNSFRTNDGIFNTGEFIIFYIRVNGITTPVEPSWTRDWVGAKVWLHTNYLYPSITCCCTTNQCGWDGSTYTSCCSSHSQTLWRRSQTYIGYGEGFDVGSPLFTQGVTLNALSEYINEETELQVFMRKSYVPINPATTGKLLLLQFDSASTVLFPYINASSTQTNYPIDCQCRVSSSSSSLGTQSPFYSTIECFMRYLPVPFVYSHTAISVNIEADTGSYIRCHFPGFKVTTAIDLKVTAKIVNKGTNLATHPVTASTYGSIYRTTSNIKHFISRTVAASSGLQINENPDLYGEGVPFKIMSGYNSVYTLGFNFGTPMAFPSFYINFQKGGPVPDNQFCSLLVICRVYSKYRNILVAEFPSNSVTSGSFTSNTVKLPKAKQPGPNSQYNIIIWAKNSGESGYTYSSLVQRDDPSLLIPTSTDFTAMPDRLTSNNYESFTSNIVLSFKLESHQLTSFWNGEAKIEIAYNLEAAAYFPINKGCIVSTHIYNDDQQFFFYCQIDTTLRLIKIQNRKFNEPFSTTGLIQVVVGAVNQAATTPITFTLRMYKWWISDANYGLLIEQEAVYTPFSVDLATQQLQLRNNIKQYPFYTRFYSDVHAPFRMAFKFATTLSVPLSYVNDLSTFMVLDGFNGIGDFPNMPFECFIKQYPNPTLNLLLPQTNGYRNYKQNTQYYFIPTYCTYINGTALKIEIPRNRDLDNTKYYELVVMPVTTTGTGFINNDNPIAKINVFPVSTAGHYFDIKRWSKDVFSLQSIWFVTKRPLEPNAIQIVFLTSFTLGTSPLAFPENYFEVTFNDLAMEAISDAYRSAGGIVPCTLTTGFSQIPLATRAQRPNCIVTNSDKLHGVIKIRVQNFQISGPSTFTISFDDFQLPEITNRLELSNSFSICLAYWSATVQHSRCFGELFVSDRHIQLTPRDDSTSTFLPVSELMYGNPSSPTVQISYPLTSSGQDHEKVMIRIKGGYSANNPAPLSFSGSNLLWHNPMIGLYIQKLTNVNSGTLFDIQISGVKNPYPYQMEEYQSDCTLQMTYFQGYYPIQRFTMDQPPYSSFIKNLPLVRMGASYLDDIKGSIKAETQSIVKLNVQIPQTYANLELHQNDRFEIQFVTNVVKVKRCWVLTVTPNIQYSKVSTCTPKPSDPKRLQLLNFWKSNTYNNLIVYAAIQASDTVVQIKSHLYARNNQQQFESPLTISVMTVSIPMTPFTELTFTENHYTPGYFEQLITPVVHSSTVQMMYLSFFLPQKLEVINSIFTIVLNSSLIIKPNLVAATGDTRLICEWMKVSKFGRQYQTGKFSHCVFNSHRIIVNAPTWNLQMNDASINRIPYLLKIRQQSPTASTFLYPQTSQVQEIILQSKTGTNFKRDTLRVRPYQHFVGLSIKHTTLTIDELNTYTIQYTGPGAIGTGSQFVLELQIDAKLYLPDIMGIEDIYEQYGQDAKNSSLIDNSLHNLGYTSLPHKWINGIPYSGWTSEAHSNLLTTIEKSDATVKINLLLPAYTVLPFIWKIPLLKNPATQKPLRMNLTLWSYPANHIQGQKQLFYEIINQHVTKLPTTAIPTIDYDITTAAQTANIIQVITGSLNIQFPNYTPVVGDIIEVKLLAKTAAFKTIPTFWDHTFIDSTYKFYYFKNINFVIAEKINGTTLLNEINFGAIQHTNEYSDEYGFEWLKIHNINSMLTEKIGNQLRKNIRACEVSAVTYQRISGKDEIVNGRFEAMFTFTTPCRVPANSTLKLISPTTDLDFLPNGNQAYCETSFRSKNCWLDSSKILYVRIDHSLVAGTVMSVTTFVKSKLRTTVTSISGEIYAIPDNPSTLVNTLPVTSLMPITSTTILDDAKLFPLIIKPLYERTLDPSKPFYTKITGTFISRHPYPTFSFMNLLSPFIQLTTSNQTFFYRKNTTGSPYEITENDFNLQWMRTQSVPTTGHDSTQKIQSNSPDGINSYNIEPSQQYLFTIGSMYETTDKNNYLVGPVGSAYRFEYKTGIANSGQIAYHEVYPLPIAETVTVINPLPQVGEETVLGIDFTSSRQDIRPLDIIQIQLDSHNLIEEMYGFTDHKLECIEFPRGVLTGPTQELVCDIAQYPDPDPAIKKPLLIHVFPTQPVAINIPVKIWISPIINSINELVAGVTVRLLRYCSGEKLCTLYEGRGWYKTINMPGTNIIDHTSGASFTPSSTIVLETMKDHQFDFQPIDLTSAFIKYPENYQDVMPLVCTRTGHSCLVFPKQRKVVTVSPITNLNTFSLIGMTNGIYVQPVDMIELKLVSLNAIAASNRLEKYQIVHPLLNERNYMPVIGATALNTFDIINTQNSNNIFLRNYWNTVKIQITGLFSTAFVKAFYIVAPPQVTDWQTNYCNATISSAAHLPYPIRLECKQITIDTIQIIIPEGVNYVPALSEAQVLTVHAKFWLQDFLPGEDILYVSPPVTSDLFQAYGSFRADSFNSQYRITKVTKQIQISQHKTPLISQVAFNTESFEERLASVNDPTTFDILIDPYSDISTDLNHRVDFIELIIPEEFKYPNVLIHDTCQLIFRRVTDLTSCKQTRKDNQTIITIDVDGNNYDNGPRILRIASRDKSNWFTAPSIPGILYNMTISLYEMVDNKPVLIETQSTKNSSRIKGYNLHLPSIKVENGKDEFQQQIFDIEFIVGPVGIKQGYRGILATGEYYSEIRVKFETVEGYEYLLGGYYKDGDRVGCVTNLRSINRQIACIFSQGTNITHEPAIILSNYEQISPHPQNPVRLSFANINNLPTSLRNTLSIEVKYYRVGDNTEDQKFAYLTYEPTEVITKPTSPLVAVPPNVLIVSYPAQTIVNEPSMFRIEIQPTQDIEQTDYIVVKFPRNGLRDEFSRFNVECSECKSWDIFYRAQVIRIYPKVMHLAGDRFTYNLRNFPSTQYIVDNPAYPITVQVYKSHKIVNQQTVHINLKMQGCRLNSGIVESTSPYIGDAGVRYTFEAQVNASQLSRSDQPKQLNLKIKLPDEYAWFSSQSLCQVELPLFCSIDNVQKRIVVKNLLSYTKPTISIRTLNVINPSALTTLSTLSFSSSMYEETTMSNVVTENTICVGAFDFTYMPSPPNRCTMSLKSEHLSTTKQNILTFGVVCEKAIRNATSVYFMVARDITFNNPMSQIYKCWTNNPSILLDIRCQIVFINGTFYLKTLGLLDIASNLLDFELNVVTNNPLIAGNYVFGAALEHAGNFYSITNNVTMTFYQTPAVQQLNTSISIQVLPEQASAEAIYVVRMPTQLLDNKLSLNFGNFGVQLSTNTKITYFQPTVNATASSTDNTNWVNQQSYFNLLQQTYTNSLSFSLRRMADLSQDIMINTNIVPKSVDGWTFIILSPITNPSSSSTSDSLKMKIIDTITTNTSTYDTLVNQLEVSMNLNIESPPSNIYQIHYSVIDNDILSSTKHTVTFKLDRKLFANQDGRQNIEIIIDPPTNSLASVKVVQTCLYQQNINTLIECKLAQIGTQELSFKPTTTNLTFLPEVHFILEFKNITNPDNETFCASKIATEKDYLASYFKTKIFIDRKLQYQSVFVGMLDDSIKPCVEFKTKKGDILHNLPAVLNAGFQTQFNISITQPTSSLRVFLSTNDTDLIFSERIIYFNAYDKMFISLKAIASSNAVNKTVEVYLKREETSAFNAFREPQSFTVRLITGQKETVAVYEMQSSSVGYEIQIPITLSKPSVNNMTLLLTVENSTILQPYLKFFTFSTLEVSIPALSSNSFFTVKYNGTQIPPTFSIHMRLTSQNNPTHILLRDVIFLFFSIDPRHQKLPPIMRMNLLWLHRSNNDLVSRTIFYCCSEDQSTTQNSNSMMLPVIIETKVLLVTATKSEIQVSTRSEATLFYQLREKGRHFELQNITSKDLRAHNLSQSTQTNRNSTKLVNSNQVLNFTNLQHQTEYFLYVSAFDAFGDSENVTVLEIKTNQLSKAIKFNLNCFKIETDEVKIVRSLADILKIDMRRIKVVSSEQNLAKKFSLSAENKPIYPHEIVISPSLTDDSMSPEDLFKTRLMDSPQNQDFLKEKIPSWTGNFDAVSQFQDRKSFYEINRVQPTFKQPPVALRISYYNASVGVKLWAKARVSAVILVEESKTPDEGVEFVNKKPRGMKVGQLSGTERELAPNSKQIIRGLNQFNEKLATKFTFSGITNEQGEGAVFFKGLKPGSYCKVFITAQNPQDFEPTTALADSQVYMIDFNLMWNPNLSGKNHLALDELKKKNEKMYNVIKEFYENQDNDKKKSSAKTKKL